MKLTLKEMAVFAVLGAMMYASKIVLDVLPNIHLLGVFISSITIVYRQKALWPLYIFVFLTGLLNGFSLWWIPYLYVWAVLWLAVFLLPDHSSPLVYMIVCGFHGLLYGVLYAPAQALIFGLDFKGMLAWIAAGFPFDAIHGISNFICGMLIVPLANVLRKLNGPAAG